MFSKLIAGTMLAGTVMAGAALAADKPTIVTVVKVTGENWFTRMNEGVDAYGKDNANVSASQVGPAKADAAQQTRIIEDLVAKNVSAIAVVPMDPSARRRATPRFTARHQGHHP